MGYTVGADSKARDVAVLELADLWPGGAPNDVVLRLIAAARDAMLELPNVGRVAWLGLRG